MYNPYQNMPVNMYQNGYLNAQNGSYQNYNQQTQQLIRVNGIDGAKAYQMGANSTVALFDNNEDVLYIKSTDGAGFPLIRTFKFEELHNLCQTKENNAQSEQYVTRKDMEDYVKQFISESATTSAGTTIQSVAD